MTIFAHRYKNCNFHDFPKLAEEKKFKMDVFGAEKLEKDNGEKIVELSLTSLQLFMF